MTTVWLVFLEWFASISALLAVVLTLTQMHSNRTHYAAVHYLGQCDAAAWPIQGLIRHFRPEMERRIAERAGHREAAE